jgi:hypothetical protein
MYRFSTLAGSYQHAALNPFDTEQEWVIIDDLQPATEVSGADAC